MTKERNKRTKLSKRLLIDALVWNCPFYVRDGAFSRCHDIATDTDSNCVKDKCTMVSEIFKTMEKIDKGEIEVF